MINNLESKSKMELVGIINVQLEEYAKLVKSEHELEKRNAELRESNSHAALRAQVQKLANENAELRKERDAILQEAKIQSCELDTQKGIIQSVRDLFDIRVYDFNLIATIKLRLEAHSLEQQLKILKEYANTCGVLRQEPSTRSLHELIMDLEAKDIKDCE